MTFPDYAAKETTDLVERLLARRSDELVHQLHAVRVALDEAARRLETPPDASAEIQDVAARIGEALAGEARRLRDEGRAELDAVRAALDAELHSNGALSSTLNELRAEHTALSRLLRERGQQIDTLDAALSAERARARSAEHDLAAARQRIDQLETTCAAATAAGQLSGQIQATLEQELRDARALLQDARSQAGELRLRLDATVAENASLRDGISAVEALAAIEAQARSAAEREARDLRASLDGALADLERLAAKLESAAAEKGRLLTELSTAQGELQTVQAQQESLGAQLRAQTAKMQAIERGHARQEDAIPHLQARSEPGQTGAPDATAASRETSLDGPNLGGSADVGSVLSILDASMQSADALGAATTIPELMNVLMAQLSTRFSRVALFTVRGNRLAGEGQIGFDHTTYVRKMVIPLGVDSMLTRVAATGELEWYTRAELAEEGKGAPFRGTPAVALALPLILRDETIGVVYADDAAHGGEAHEPAEYRVRVRLAHLLVRQAALSLMRLTEELRTLGELREYAATLVEGAEQMYVVDIENRRAPEDLRRRLQANLGCARQIFEGRVSAEGVGDVTLLDEQIASLVQGRADDQFARELAAIAGIPYAAPPQSAEAS